jgi:hypothetical protein
MRDLFKQPSGYRGTQVILDDESSQSPFLRLLGVGAVGGASFAAYKQLLTNPQYADKAYRAAVTFEERSPWRIGRTLGVSERLSSYLPKELTFKRADLVFDGKLNQFGDHFQRLFGDRVNVAAQEELRFARKSQGSSYMDLLGHPGTEVRFAPSGGRVVGSSARYNAPLHPKVPHRAKGSNIFARAYGQFRNEVEAQVPRNLYGGASGAQLAEHQLSYLPYHARFDEKAEQAWKKTTQGLKNLRTRVGLETFEASERAQKLFAEVGFGLRQGSYNKVFHTPFVGEGGLINGLLTKRVLPLALAVTGFKYLDYKLAHKPSSLAIDTGVKANVLRADLTDMVPGARGITDAYKKVVPGPQYGPLALPLAGAFAGGLIHYGRVLKGRYANTHVRDVAGSILGELAAVSKEGHLSSVRLNPKVLGEVKGLKSLWSKLGTPGKGALIGLAAMLPFIPGMVGSRRTGNELRDVYSGKEPVPIRSGRWWELGSSAFAGGRIKEWRPHWSVLYKSRAQDKSLYGTEENYWAHNPILHPFKYLRDPYYLEELHYQDRPYGVTSPAFSDVPLIGPIAAATIGRLVKPEVRMHEDQWSGEKYSLYSTRLEPKGPDALPPPELQSEFSLKNIISRQAEIAAEFTGLYGFLMKSAKNAVLPDTNKGRNVYFQGSRQMTSLSRQYYDLELGAGLGPNPAGGASHFGYTEPFRRFVQREGFEPQANEIPNEMPSWMPGEDYFTNFRVGDPFVKTSDGFSRLPGAGYEALHPEVEGLDPENYPDVTKLSILGDVAPYSREFARYKMLVGRQAKSNTELAIEYEKVMDRVRQTRESVMNTTRRRFSDPVEEIEGTVEDATSAGVHLKEYPGRIFRFSSVGTSAADMSAAILGENNSLTSEQVAREVDQRRSSMFGYLDDALSPGTHVHVTTRLGAPEHSEDMRSVIEADGEIINQSLIDHGFGIYREDLGGAESQAMHGFFGRAVGKLAESLSFTGDNSPVNPLRYIPSPAHTKFWQERTALAQYISQEVSGTRMRRWNRPFHDFVGPYTRGLAGRLTGQNIIPEDVQHRRDLNTMADMLAYLRALRGQGSGQGTGYTNQIRRTSVGANLLGSDMYVASTLPDRDARYFRKFMEETDPDKRSAILDVVPEEMSRALTTQWAAQEDRIAAAEGKDPGSIGENGRLYTDEEVGDYRKAKTKLDYANYLRSKEIANFFSRTGFTLPDSDSPVYDEALDYQDVKLKIIQQEGYDAHDFNLFDDRASLLWRKPYVDGAVRELTAGNQGRSVEQLRRAVEQLMLVAGNKNPNIKAIQANTHRSRSNVRVDVDVDEQEALLRDMRRNPEKYQEQ